MKFLVQERTMTGTKRWKAGKYGTRRQVMWTPWKTIYQTADLAEAARERERRNTGLFERKVMYGGETVITPRGATTSQHWTERLRAAQRPIDEHPRSPLESRTHEEQQQQ